MSSTKTVYEVIYDAASAGPAGDGTHIARFRTKRDADNFASTHTAWGRPTTATAAKVSTALARRWGL